MTSSTLTREATRPKFTDLFIQRPVVAVMITLALILFGLRATIDLPVLQYPRIESSSLLITTPYIGASAETVQGFITEPIERVAASVPGVDHIESNTTAGMSTVTVFLRLNEDSTGALAELSARLAQIRFELPAGAEDPAVAVQRADRPNAAFYLDVPVSAAYNHAQISDYLTRRVNPILTSIPGVQEVILSGGRSPAMRIWLDPARMAAADVSAQDIEVALSRNNIIATIGHSENENQRIDLLVNTSLKAAGEFERMVVRRSGNALIRLADVARVELGEEEPTSVSRSLHLDVVYIAVSPQPGANEIAIADRVYEQLDAINATLPAGLHIGIAYDVTVYMRSALRGIFTTLGETILLVGIVVIVMMGSLRMALVPLLTIPVSLLGATAAMWLMGFSLNLLTVLAIVLSVGLVVDDAIVMVENVARYLREGMSRTEAALASSRQLVAPIIAMTITLATVYVPIGFLSGLTGVLFKEFAFTLAVAVLISGFMALTLSPVMSAWVAPSKGQENAVTRWVNGLFLQLQHNYGRLLQGLLRSNAQVIVTGVFIALLVVPFFMFSQSELAPTEDQSSINVTFSAPPEATLAYTGRYMHDVVAAMESLPGSSRMWQVLQPSGGYSGMEFVDFRDREQSVHELLPQAFAALSGVTGLTTFPILPAALPTAGNYDVELVVTSSDPAEVMLPYAEKLIAAAMASGRFMFADTDLRIDLPQGQFILDRTRIADLGMDLTEVSRQLGMFLSSNYVNRFDLDGRAYRVIPMVQKGGRPDPDALLDLQIRTPGGALIPFSAIARLEQISAPRVLGKFQQNNAFRVFGGVLPGITKEQGLVALEEAAASLLPPGYAIDYAGESRQLRIEGNTLLGVLGFSLAFVYMCLAVQFNSFRDPLVVLLGSVPLALSGAMLFAFLGWTTINIYSQVGFITLVGLIAKNAILVVEFARQLQADGASKLEAIQASAQTRLRPVLMTTGATVMGHFPLVLVTGPGAEARNSIGIILVAGMLLGTMFTLFILPGIYMLIAATPRAVPNAPGHDTVIVS